MFGVINYAARQKEEKKKTLKVVGRARENLMTSGSFDFMFLSVSSFV